MGDQLGALGHARHPQPRLVEPAGPVAVIILEDLARIGMDHDRHIERRGDRIDGDVVVGRPDPAGREQIIVAGAERIDRLDDALLVVGDDPHLGQPDALVVEPGRELRDILVLGPARQDLVADHRQGGGPGLLFAHLKCILRFDRHFGFAQCLLSMRGVFYPLILSSG